ncbi:MAG: addiction module protein [Deltaproteobacteria bacterium]|nr:addiction module protein [Deltaproteobacteria bacterium]
MSQVDTILEQVALLTPEERAELRIRLLDADEGVDEEAVEHAWGEEIARRLRAYKRGEMGAVPGTEAIARVDALLASLRA